MLRKKSSFKVNQLKNKLVPSKNFKYKNLVGNRGKKITKFYKLFIARLGKIKSVFIQRKTLIRSNRPRFTFRIQTRTKLHKHLISKLYMLKRKKITHLTYSLKNATHLRNRLDINMLTTVVFKKFQIASYVRYELRDRLAIKSIKLILLVNSKLSSSFVFGARFNFFS